MQVWQKIEIFQIQDGRRTPFWKSFLAIYRRHIGRSTRNLEQRWMITCRYRSRDHDCNFRKFKMADGRHFENSFISISQPRIIRVRSTFVRLCKFHSEDGYLTKIEIFQIQDGGLTPYWKSFFGYISAPYWPINAKFGTEMKDHMPMYYQWTKVQFLQSADIGQ